MYEFQPLRWYNRQVHFASLVLPHIPGIAWNYYTDIHPRTESQYQAQMFLRGLSPRYDTWMVNRSVDERNRNLRGMYNIQFSDITYPHISGVTSENTTKQYGSMAWEFSKNMARLYK